MQGDAVLIDVGMSIKPWTMPPCWYLSLTILCHGYLPIPWC